MIDEGRESRPGETTRAATETSGEDVRVSLPPVGVTDRHRAAADVRAYLRAFVEQAPDAPLLRELDPSELGAPRGTASIARAALAWLEDGSPEVIAERLRAELTAADLYVRYRLAE